MFCEAAIRALFDAKTLSPTDTAHAKLGFSHPADSRGDQITIQDLLDHKGGYDNSIAPYFDPTYQMGQIAKSLAVAHLTGLDSNYGYLLLATIVDKVSAQGSYYSYLQSTLLQPAGITEVGIISTLASGRTNQEAIAEDPGLGMNALDLTSPHKVPAVYRGDGEINEVGVANDGLRASARALAQFAHLHAAWDNWGSKPRRRARRKHAGASTYVWSRADGVDAAFTLNTRTWPAGSDRRPLRSSTACWATRRWTGCAFVQALRLIDRWERLGWRPLAGERCSTVPPATSASRTF